MSCCQFNLVICNRRLWSILSLTCWLNIPSEHPLWSHDITNLTDTLEEWVMNPPHSEFFNTKIADRFQIIVLQFAFTVSSVQTLVYPYPIVIPPSHPSTGQSLYLCVAPDEHHVSPHLIVSTAHKQVLLVVILIPVHPTILLCWSINGIDAPLTYFAMTTRGILSWSMNWIWLCPCLNNKPPFRLQKNLFNPASSLKMVHIPLHLHP